MTFLSIIMEVTQTLVKAGGNERVKVGEVMVNVPSVADLMPDAVQATKEGKPEYDTEGLPVFTDNKHNWIQQAIFAQAKAQARNKLKPKTAELKDGAKIAETWEELTAVNTGGGAEHLALIREVKGLFGKWAASLGKSQAAYNNMTDLFNDPKALKVAKDTTKEKMAAYLSEFLDTLSDAEAAKYASYLEKVEAATSNEETEADDF